MSPLISTFQVHPKSIICTMEETNKSIDCSAYWESTKLSLFQSLKKMRIFLQRHFWFQVLYHMKLYISLHKVVKTWYIGFLSMSCHWAFAITIHFYCFTSHLAMSEGEMNSYQEARTKFLFLEICHEFHCKTFAEQKKAESAIKLREIQLCNSAVDFFGLLCTLKEVKVF